MKQCMSDEIENNSAGQFNSLLSCVICNMTGLSQLQNYSPPVRETELKRGTCSVPVPFEITIMNMEIAIGSADFKFLVVFVYQLVLTVTLSSLA